MKTGRKLIPINAREVSNYAMIGATDTEIANFFGCNETTIRNRFSEILTKARSKLRLKLRRAQLKAAFNGNVTMQIFLGKNMLGQADVQEMSHDGAIKIQVSYRPPPTVDNPRALPTSFGAAEGSN